MLLRAVTGQTVVLPFVVVALLALGVFLLGYRLLVSGVVPVPGTPPAGLMY